MDGVFSIFPPIGRTWKTTSKSRKTSLLHLTANDIEHHQTEPSLNNYMHVHFLVGFLYLSLSTYKLGHMILIIVQESEAENQF